TAAICMGLNLLCGAASLVVFRQPDELAPTKAATEPRRARRVLATLALTGLLGIGYEVLVVRVLSQVTENTVYTFAALLSVYLIGTAAGAAGYQRWLVKGAEQDDVADRLLGLLAAACLVGTATLWLAERAQARAR